MSEVVNHVPMTSTELSILLPAHNNVCVPLVAELQRQAARLQGLRYEILVADDGSTDAKSVTANRAINHLPCCRLIERKDNVGRAAIRNFLAREARYEHLLFIDSDLHICSPSFVKRYVKARGDVVVGGVRIGGDERKWAGNLRYRYEKACENEHDWRHRSMRSDQEFRTTNFAIARSLMLACPFDENFRHYGYEDVLLGKAISARGTAIKHIDNPILLDDYEDNLLFVEKTEEACRTLHQFRNELRGYSKLIRWQETLGRHRVLSHLMERAYSVMGSHIRRHLITGAPSPRLFNAYKLLYYMHLCH